MTGNPSESMLNPRLRYVTSYGNNGHVSEVLNDSEATLLGGGEDLAFSSFSYCVLFEQNIA